MSAPYGMTGRFAFLCCCLVLPTLYLMRIGMDTGKREAEKRGLERLIVFRQKRERVDDVESEIGERKKPRGKGNEKRENRSRTERHTQDGNVQQHQKREEMLHRSIAYQDSLTTIILLLFCSPSRESPESQVPAVPVSLKESERVAESRVLEQEQEKTMSASPGMAWPPRSFREVLVFFSLYPKEKRAREEKDGGK